MSKAKSRLHTNPLSYCDGGGANYEWLRIFNNMKMMALNRYRWENLPNGMKSSYIEEALFERGEAFFFEDNMLGPVCLPCNAANKLNLYGEPEAFTVTGKGNGYVKYLKADQGVRIRDNDLMFATKFQIIHFAEKMQKLEALYEKNMQQQHRPFVAKANRDTLYSVRNIMNDVANGEDCVIIDESLDSGNKDVVQIMNTKPDYLLALIREEMQGLERELLTFLGLDNIADKRERMVVDEVHSNDTSVDAHLDVFFKCRQEACELINEKFGLNIRVVKVVDELNREEAEIQAELFKKLGFDQYDNIKTGGTGENGKVDSEGGVE